MSDVRLTATNPEDSSAVPVACNAKGELLLEEIPDQSFDGDLDGNLTVSGSGTFASNGVFGSFDLSNANTSGVRINPSGSLQIQRDSAASNSARFQIIRGVDDETVAINSDGSASFAGGDLLIHDSGTLRLGSPSSSTSGGNIIFSSDGSASFAGRIDSTGGVGVDTGSSLISTGIYYRDDSGAFGLALYKGGSSQINRKAFIKTDGSASFAGNKAGFTSDGNLWCTTVRGDTVILDATSNGLASWTAYTPPTRRELLEEQIEDIKDAAIKPSQDLPETETGTQ